MEPEPASAANETKPPEREGTDHLRRLTSIREIFLSSTALLYQIDVVCATNDDALLLQALRMARELRRRAPGLGGPMPKHPIISRQMPDLDMIEHHLRFYAGGLPGHRILPRWYCARLRRRVLRKRQIRLELCHALDFYTHFVKTYERWMLYWVYTWREHLGVTDITEDLPREVAMLRMRQYMVVPVAFWLLEVVPLSPAESLSLIENPEEFSSPVTRARARPSGP